MNSLYEPATVQDLTERINKLTPSSQRLWGKMDVAQMLAHCATILEITLGDKKGKSTLMGKLIGPLVKSVITSEKPFKQNLPTDANFLIADSRDFKNEKTRLITFLHRLSAGGAGPMHHRRHPFFGKMTSNEWSTATVKHLDHHLRQFGV